MQEGSTKEVQLSPQQKHLWLLQEADRDRHYRAHATVMLEGRLNLTLLHAALEQVVQRHDILRTAFQQMPWLKLPVQAIAEHAAPILEHVDLSDCDAPTQARQLAALRHSATHADFDVTHAPLLRAWLITVAPTQHLLLLSLSALYADTTTLVNLVRELSRTYAAQVQGMALDDEPLQYPELAEILNELVEGEDTEAAADYWRDHHAGNWPRLSLPFAGRQQSASADGQSASVRLQLQPELTGQIQALTRDSAYSTATVLLSCWYTLLWRLTEQSEIVVGVAYDGRTYEGMDTALGLLARNLPLRCRIAPHTRFDALLAQVGQVMEEVYEWQDYFTWKYVVALEQSASQPLCPFSFEFFASPGPITVPGLTVTLTAYDASIDAYHIKLAAIQTDDGGLELLFHYDPRLFRQSDVERLSAQYHTLLAGLTTNVQAELARVEMVSQAERQRLVSEFNTTAGTYPASSCVHQIFEEQVARTPDANAVIFEGQQLTYAQLNAQANQLARYLRGLGVGAHGETLVGVCVERSPELMVALLGILKAGGAYVPLDPAYPQERLAWILEDTQAPVVVTQQHLRERLPYAAAKLVDLDADRPRISAEDSANLDSLVQPENLAYVIYTSGSTGKPKGTMVQHRGLVNYLAWSAAAYDVQNGQGTLVHSSIGFDLTVTSLWAPLMVGQVVTLVPEQASIEGLVAALRGNQHFSLIKITPTHLDLLGQMLPTEQPAGSVQALVIGGEALRHEALAFWRTHAPGTRLINEYGPTETVVGCVVYEVTEEPPLGSSVPIGRPIANTQVYVLDQYGQLTPTGAIGELYIGGVGVTRGYVKRPDLTATQFVPDPFSATPGARLYRSGDLVRYRQDGNLEFIGRNDHQIKLHGFRIEPGEIEAVLASHPRVRDVVAVARETTPGNIQLVAYVVEDNEPTEKRADASDSQPALSSGRLSSAELRSFLQERLPEHMIPAHFVLLPELPLTTNGKVDRAALPAPTVERPTSEPGSALPRTPIEEQLAAIWQEVLRLEHVGIHDNFFELGGDSILSIQIVAKANKVGIQLLPKHLFQHRTIAELAAVAGTAPKIQAEQGLVTGSAPLTPIQHWFFEQNQPEPHHWNQTLLLEARQPLDPALVEQALQQILTHHDVLRLRFTRQADGIWTQQYAAPDAAPPFDAISLAALPAAEQATAITTHASDLQARLDLATGPLLRVAYFDLGPEQPGRLLIVAHHLVVDGVSWRILLEDLQTAYEQLSHGEAVTLPAKTTSFKHWAEQLAAYAQQSPIAAELPHWLAEAQSSRSLPTDQPTTPDARAIAHTEIVSVTLDAAATQALIQEVPAAYNTQINDVLITALAQAFAQWTGSQTLSLNLEGHGREDLLEDVDLSRTVGWFTTIFPVLVDLRGVDGPGNALKAVKEQLRRVPQRGIGYGLLRYLRHDDPIAQQLARLPEAEVSFNYLGQMDQVVSDGLFGPAYESSGASRSPRGHRRYLLEINGGLLNGQLRVDWTYSSQVHRRATIEALAHNFIAALQALITHCQSPDAGSYTPSDFPDEDLSTDDLDTILSQISKI